MVKDASARIRRGGPGGGSASKPQKQPHLRQHQRGKAAGAPSRSFPGVPPPKCGFKSCALALAVGPTVVKFLQMQRATAGSFPAVTAGTASLLSFAGIDGGPAPPPDTAGAGRRRVWGVAHSAADVWGMGDGEIRDWGCPPRNETPFLFYHISKAGGGSIRRKLASAGRNYSAAQREPKFVWRKASNYGVYYPVPVVLGDRGGGDSNGTPSSEAPAPAPDRGRFCNSEHVGFHPTQEKHYFEGEWPCLANTPLGHAVACPYYDPGRSCCDPAAERCPIVYAGHNGFGNELHWLPPRYLRRWWDEQQDILSALTQDGDDEAAAGGRTLKMDGIGSYIDTIHTDDWCTDQAGKKHKLNAPPRIRGDRITNMGNYLNCSVPISTKVDELSYEVFPTPRNNETKSSSTSATALAVAGAARDEGEVEDWSKLYASLPVLRATMMRDPFSWLLSKFFWGVWKKKEASKYDCGDIGFGVTEMDHTTFIRSIPADYKGWMSVRSVGYIYMLCGEDCESRIYNQKATLDDIVTQAEHNLRRSFAVVGLLNETETFYAMIHARVHYLDLYHKKESEGGRHSSKNNHEDYARCKALYASPEFQQRLIEASPEVAALQRLWETAVEVNRHQLAELQACTSPEQHPSLFLPMNDDDHSNTGRNETGLE